MEQTERYELSKKLAIEWVCNGKEPSTIYEQNMVKTFTGFGQVILSRALEVVGQKPCNQCKPNVLFALKGYKFCPYCGRYRLVETNTSL